MKKKEELRKEKLNRIAKSGICYMSVAQMSAVHIKQTVDGVGTDDRVIAVHICTGVIQVATIRN